jgi:hypothetical protein
VKIDRDDAQYREGREEKREDKKKKQICMSSFFIFFGKIVPQTHNILFKPTETLAKNTKKTKTPNARKKMLRPPVESRF